MHAKFLLIVGHKPPVDRDANIFGVEACGTSQLPKDDVLGSFLGHFKFVFIHLSVEETSKSKGEPLSKRFENIIPDRVGFITTGALGRSEYDPHLVLQRMSDADDVVRAIRRASFAEPLRAKSARDLIARLSLASTDCGAILTALSILLQALWAFRGRHVKSLLATTDISGLDERHKQFLREWILRSGFEPTPLNFDFKHGDEQDVVRCFIRTMELLESTEPFAKKGALKEIRSLGNILSDAMSEDQFAWASNGLGKALAVATIELSALCTRYCL